MTVRSFRTMPAVLVVVAGLLAGCGADPPEDVEAERDVGLSVADASGALARLALRAGNDPVDWTVSAEEAAKKRIDQLVANLAGLSLRCIQVDRKSDTQVEVTYSECRRIQRFLQIQGHVLISAEADFEADPPRLTFSWNQIDLSINRFELEGRAEFVYYKDGLTGFGFNGQITDGPPVTLQMDGRVRTETDGTDKCATLSALGFGVVDTVQVSTSLTDVTFCTSCPHMGEVGVAGRFLQRIGFDDEGGRLIEEGIPSTRIPLPCERDLLAGSAS